MHEFSLMRDLLAKVDGVLRQSGGTNVKRVRVRLGALAHISPAHFREHFVQGTRGTRAEGCKLDIEVGTATDDPQAQDIVLKSVDVN